MSESKMSDELRAAAELFRIKPLVWTEAVAIDVVYHRTDLEAGPSFRIVPFGSQWKMFGPGAFSVHETVDEAKQEADRYYRSRLMEDLEPVAYVSASRLDDCEPVTGEWFYEQGFLQDRQCRGRFYSRSDSHSRHVEWYEPMAGYKESGIRLSGEWLPHIKSRGQVWRLLSALAGE